MYIFFTQNKCKNNNIGCSSTYSHMCSNVSKAVEQISKASVKK